MNLEHKKSVLFCMLEGLDREDIIDELISVAWKMERSKGLAPVEKSAEAPAPKKNRGTPVTIYGEDYPSLRHAVVKVWGKTESDYVRVYREMMLKGTPLENLLPPLEPTPIKSPLKRLLTTAPNGEIRAE